VTQNVLIIHYLPFLYHRYHLIKKIITANCNLLSDIFYAAFLNYLEF